MRAKLAPMVVDSVKVADGSMIVVGDYVRVIHVMGLPNSGPPVGSILPVVGLTQNSVHVPWAVPKRGYYGKMPECVVKAYEPDLQVDEGL